jgi:hypothetical protein
MGVDRSAGRATIASGMMDTHLLSSIPDRRIPLLIHVLIDEPGFAAVRLKRLDSHAAGLWRK